MYLIASHPYNDLGKSVPLLLSPSPFYRSGNWDPESTWRKTPEREDKSAECELRQLTSGAVPSSTLSIWLYTAPATRSPSSWSRWRPRVFFFFFFLRSFRFKTKLRGKYRNSPNTPSHPCTASLEGCICYQLIHLHGHIIVTPNP